MKIKFECKVKSLKIEGQPADNTVKWKICDEEVIANIHFGKGIGVENNKIYFLSTSDISLKTDVRRFSFISQHADKIFSVVVEVSANIQETTEKNEIDLFDGIVVVNSDKVKMTLSSVELIYG